MRILIVDDNEIELGILENSLLTAGYEVLQAANGLDALEALRHNDCHLVISDWVMPHLSGIELCRAVRSREFSRYIYFILLTSRDSHSERLEGMAAGADDFISKPYEHAELIAQIRAGERILSLETRDVAIFALAKLAESRDPETGAHLERVQNYCRVLAQQLAGVAKFRGQIGTEFINLLYQTSPLHDIGKVGIPDAVLLKPGRLDAAEFAIMRTHTLIGAATLDAALRKFPGAKFLEMARDIAATHHERFDGNGYPNRLAGSAIPLAGRIVAVADVYDALTSKRVYKEAFSHEDAMATIVRDSGTHFDPDVVGALLGAEPQFISVRRRFAEAMHAAPPAVMITGNATPSAAA
jgi:putative two-component system response regulator